MARADEMADAATSVVADDSPIRQIVLATHNRHKVEEFQAIVAATRPDLQVIAYDGPEPVEDGATFVENAVIKARTAARRWPMTPASAWTSSAGLLACSRRTGQGTRRMPRQT
jgi:hypothetical protein